MKTSHIKNQFTPTYHRLWNREFSALIMAELLLCISCYMTIPFLPYLLLNNYINLQMACLTMIVFVAGICISGFFCSWLTQHYRRNKVFCISTLCLSGAILGTTLFYDTTANKASQQYTIMLMSICLLCGILFGNSKRILSCTLLIDKTESCHRTEANYAAIWIARIAVLVGPMLALLLKKEMHNLTFHLVAAITIIVAMLLVMSVKFPFRAPEEGIHLLSLDRFFLTNGWNIAIVIAIMSASLGIILISYLTLEFCMSVIVGLVTSIIILKFPEIRNGRYTSAVGNICILIAISAISFHNGFLDATLKPMILGLGYGMTSSEQLYKLLNCCNHCQRSTAESTYFMASDGGLFIGIAAGLMIKQSTFSSEYIAFGLFVFATIICSINAMVKKRQTAYHA